MFIENIMIYSKRNSLLWGVLASLLNGCATSSFEVIKKQKLATELKVTPDRILIECQKETNHDNGDAFGFLMYVLDSNNTVICFVQTNVLDKRSCDRRIQKIGNILKTGKSIFVGGMGDLISPKKFEKATYSFPKLGTFPSNGQNLQFIVIANENGFCYDAYSGDEKPCPRDPFTFGKGPW